MARYVLRTPLSEDDVVKLHVGDIVYINGIVITARDLTHRRIIEDLDVGKLPRALFDGSVIYHAGPVVKHVDGTWHVVSIGPTTSIRMETYTPKLLERARIRLIVGKGGMGRSTLDALVRHRCVYGIFPGGCGIVAAKCVKRVLDVFYLDELGVPEAMWILEVEMFGPIIIAMDTHGRTLCRLRE